MWPCFCTMAKAMDDAVSRWCDNESSIAEVCPSLSSRFLQIAIAVVMNTFGTQQIEWNSELMSHPKNHDTACSMALILVNFCLH